MSDTELRTQLTEDIKRYEQFATDLKQPRFHHGARLCDDLLRCLASETMSQGIADQMWNRVHDTTFFHPSWYDLRGAAFRWAKQRGFHLDWDRPVPARFTT